LEKKKHLRSSVKRRRLLIEKGKVAETKAPGGKVRPLRKMMVFRRDGNLGHYLQVRGLDTETRATS